MRLRITSEPSKGGELFYLREAPHDPGRTIQITALSLDGARWLASRITGVESLELPKDTKTT
jgi:hypothetical protein